MKSKSEREITWELLLQGFVRTAQYIGAYLTRAGFWGNVIVEFFSIRVIRESNIDSLLWLLQ